MRRIPLTLLVAVLSTLSWTSAGCGGDEPLIPTRFETPTTTSTTTTTTTMPSMTPTSLGPVFGTLDPSASVSPDSSER
ncbi:MAG: hypothetical protein R2698_09295 [Microthrixaceae bacterium]